MALPDPERGLVIRYDFLWKEEQDEGQDHGRKDRPCAVILVLKADEEGQRKIVVCPITHSPPQSPDEAVEIPSKVAKALGLDWERSWIKTHEVNRFVWPHGLLPASKGEWSFGFLPPKLYEKVRDQLLQNVQNRRAKIVDRDD